MSRSNTIGIRSMTGQGHATAEDALGTITAEVRTVNNRGFKCTLRLSDSLASLDSRIEALARSLIHRGTVHLSVSWRRPSQADCPNMDVDVLTAYYQQLKQVQDRVGSAGASIDLASLLGLPGVMVTSREERREDDQLWQFVSSVIRRAIDNLNQMREVEGGHMAETLLAECSQIGNRLETISTLAPRAVDNYRTRLETKIARILAEHDIQAQPVDLLREVQIYADRADVSEEITRLGSHLKMFAAIVAGQQGESGSRDPTGRKLDFVIQEMFRETNTIGSKAADAEVSAQVVEIKCAIERMRELVQNLE
jgi:uncharacterized protein (TIGR00255 family)